LNQTYLKVTTKISIAIQKPRFVKRDKLIYSYKLENIDKQDKDHN